MALTIAYDTPNAERVSQNYRVISGTIAFDSSYPTGGESFDLSGKLKNVANVQIQDSIGYMYLYDYTNKKVKVMTPHKQHTHTITITGGEAGTVACGIASDANDVALSKTSATDRTGITGIQNAAADAATEVANATDLSSITGVRFFAWGYE